MWRIEYLTIITIGIVTINEVADGDENYAKTQNLQDFCETEVFNVTCNHDHVILMTQARYGRMRISRCVKQDYGHVGCSSDVIEMADVRCSGKKSCLIRIPDAIFTSTKPCPDDLKPYLSASYLCVKVEHPSSVCQTPGIISLNWKPDSTSQIIPFLNKPGLSSITPVYQPNSVKATISYMPLYLSSDVTHATYCGSTRSPWLAQVERGQKIQLTFLDFGLARKNYPIIFERSESQFDDIGDILKTQLSDYYEDIDLIENIDLIDQIINITSRNSMSSPISIQKKNETRIVLKPQKNEESSLSSSSQSNILPLAVAVDKAAGKNVTVYSDSSREATIYTSKGHQLEIIIITSQDHSVQQPLFRRFLLRLQGRLLLSQ